jgi:hypothetical protein
MSLRDYFAATALPSAIQQATTLVASDPILSKAADSDQGRAVLLRQISMMAYSLADAMLDERAK